MVGITITVGPIVIVVCNEIVVETVMKPPLSDDVCVGVVWLVPPCWARAIFFFFFPPTPPPTTAAMITMRATTAIIMIPFLVR
jgi:hypothetical protein